MDVLYDLAQPVESSLVRMENNVTTYKSFTLGGTTYNQGDVARIGSETATGRKLFGIIEQIYKISKPSSKHDSIDDLLHIYFRTLSLASEDAIDPKLKTTARKHDNIVFYTFICDPNIASFILEKRQLQFLPFEEVPDDPPKDSPVLYCTHVHNPHTHEISPIDGNLPKRVFESTPLSVAEIKLFWKRVGRPIEDDQEAQFDNLMEEIESGAVSHIKSAANGSSSSVKKNALEDLRVNLQKNENVVEIAKAPPASLAKVSTSTDVENLFILFENFKKLYITQQRIKSLLTSEGFEKLVVGHYVKVRTNEKNILGEPKECVCQVLKVVPYASTYQFLGEDCNKYLFAQRGTDNLSISLAQLSDKELLLEEYQDWIAAAAAVP